MNVTFRVDLNKNANYSIGPATVFIDVYNSSGNRTEKDIAYVPVSAFSTSASKNFSINILASDINFGNGNYLKATLKQDNQPGAEWYSQQIPIVKTPSFQLTPNPLDLVCGDISPKTFTVTNSSNLSGVTYQWSIGNGWSGNVGNGNSITLTPNSGNILPSNVSVTPIYNGQNLSTLSSIVRRASFSTTATINGSSTLCSIGTYTMNNLPNGVTIQSVSSSNTNVATVSLNTNNGQITATKVSNGTFTLSIVLQNACSQPTTKTKTIQAGENANVDITGLENGINAGSSVSISLTNTNGCGTIYYTSASSGLTFDYVGPDYAVLSSTSSNSGTGWVYISITGGTSIYKEFPINVIPPPVLPNANYISVARIANNYNVYPYNQWKMVKAYYYGNSSDVTYWEWNIGNSYYAKPNDTSVIFLPSTSSNVTVNVRACNNNGCSSYVSTVIN
ncbi:hypothetical protein [Mariniflexile maritimum]|uniref:hypothetical protein n=1 Tax=Mariniflexile maritimum TaxID=2682493 RepID=UPI0012F660E0|nr:hypothetical protein [Mariniflexile maritimum]